MARNGGKHRDKHLIAHMIPVSLRIVEEKTALAVTDASASQAPKCKKRPPRREAAESFYNYRSLAIDSDRTMVAVPVSVVITVLPDNNCLITIPAVPIPKMLTVAIAIAMTFTHRHARRAYTDSDFLRSGGNCAANTHHGGHYYCVSYHCVLR
jgi:hypothetical protein